MQKSERLPRIASVVAFVIAGIVILGAALGPIMILPFTFVPLCAGIGILRGRAWSAYGLATYFFAQILLLALIPLRPWYANGRVPKIVVMELASVGLGILFLFAGRTLTIAGATRGRAWPWILSTALFTIPFFFVQTFEVATESMEKTLLPGDSIFAQTFPLSHPKRGQLVLFISPTERNVVLIKRVIAVPSDHLRIAKKIVILNGTALDEKYVTHESDRADFYPDDFPNAIELPGCAEGHEMLSQQAVNGEIVVPEGGYFVLGDQRENSLDSRCWGFIRSEDVIGRPLMIYDSIEHDPDQVSNPDWRWFGHRRWSRLFKGF